jgi:prepilin-type N-terminal cleavage/methylation domain-containing protein
MNRKGFTLIELVMVLILIGIVASVIAPRLGEMSSVEAGVFADKLRADLRYAQNLAMTRKQRYRAYFDASPAPNPGYAVVNDANGNGTWGEAGEFAQDPAGGGSLSVALNTGKYAGIGFSSIGFAGSYLEFNSLGVPFDGGGALIADKSVTISPGGATITVTARTGAVN